MTDQHPALAALRAGSPSEAIACLAARGDHPAALALLKAGHELYATYLLEDLPAQPPEPTRSPDP